MSIDMTTAPAANVQEGIQILEKRIGTGKLGITEKNARQLFAWLVISGVDLQTAEPRVIADTLEGRIRKHLFDNLLDWKEEPKALQVRKQNEGIARLKSAQESQADFIAKKKAGEQADAKKKADEQTLIAIAQQIANIQLIDRNGRIVYGRTDAAKDKLRKQVEQRHKSGVAVAEIQRWVFAQVDELYAADQRSRERV